MEAELLQSDTVVARASPGCSCARASSPGRDLDLPGRDAATATASRQTGRGAAAHLGLRQEPGASRDASFDLTQWEHDGPKFVWVRDVVPLVDGVPPTPFIRASMAGDVASSFTHYGTEGLDYINADYTLTLSRLPEGTTSALRR